MLTVSPTPWGFVQIYGNREPRDAPGEKGHTHTPWVWVLGSAANGLLKIQPLSPDGPGKNPPGAGGAARCGAVRFAFLRVEWMKTFTYILFKEATKMANSMTYKTYTAKRMENMRACDGKNYKFTADWSKPQSKTVCQSALKSISDKLSRIAKQKTWGSKEDTPALIAELISLLPNAQLGSDDMQNSFLCYQTERYFLRIWWRGTAEEREKVVPKTKAPAKKTTAKKTETAAPAPAKKAPAKKASKKTGKTVTVKTEVVEDQIEPEVITVDAPTKAIGQVMDTLVQLLTEELTNEQKQKFVSALTIALQQSF